MTTVRVQGPDGSQSLELAADATVGDLKDAIADKLGIPTAAQTLLTGFPPSTLTAIVPGPSTNGAPPGSSAVCP